MELYVNEGQGHFTPRSIEIEDEIERVIAFDFVFDFNRLLTIESCPALSFMDDLK